MCWRQVERQSTNWLHSHQSINHCSMLVKAIEFKNLIRWRIIPINQSINHCTMLIKAIEFKGSKIWRGEELFPSINQPFCYMLVKARDQKSEKVKNYSHHSINHFALCSSKQLNFKESKIWQAEELFPSMPSTIAACASSNLLISKYYTSKKVKNAFHQ